VPVGWFPIGTQSKLRLLPSCRFHRLLWLFRLRLLFLLLLLCLALTPGLRLRVGANDRIHRNDIVSAVRELARATAKANVVPVAHQVHPVVAIAGEFAALVVEGSAAEATTSTTAGVLH